MEVQRSYVNLCAKDENKKKLIYLGGIYYQ